MTTTGPSPKPLNRFEVWASDHATHIFGAIALLIVLGAAAVFYTYQRTGDAEDQIRTLTPKVAHIIKCNQHSLVDEKRAEECAARIRIGLINCRRVESCRAAYLALATFPVAPGRGVAGDSSGTEGSRRDRATAEPSSPIGTTSRGPAVDVEGGDALQPPSSHGHQQEGPESTGPTEEAAHEPESAVSPSPAPAPSQGESPATSTETPETSPQPAPTAPKPSAPTVELCVLEHTCLGVEAGLGELLPKGTQ